MWWRLILSVRCISSAHKEKKKQKKNKQTNKQKQTNKKKYKYRRRKKKEPAGMNLCAFSAAQDVCSKLENQAKCDSAVFIINRAKPVSVY